MTMNSFRALLVTERDGKVSSGFATLDETQLDPGSVTIRVAYSSVNYKDALAATGAGRIIRRFPCVAGIDLSGTVTQSSDPRFQPGDKVIATSFDIGVAHHGGYAELARVPGEWVVPLPPGLTLFEAMALGTAGFTAALAIVRMEENRLSPANGPVLVTGATGGVGSLAIDMLAGRGYEVVAVSGKAEADDYLRGLGAARILRRQDIDPGKRPMEKALWAGAIDNLGGDLLAWLTRTVDQWGNIASVGLAAGAELKTTVMPFILRGVNLLGINSVYTPRELRLAVWARLAGDLRPRHLDAICTKVVDLDALPAQFDDYLKGRVIGRTVVKIS